MSQVNGQIAFWFLVVVQVGGLVSGCLARITDGSASQSSCQRVFLGCLALVSVATMLSIALSPASWLACSATLAVMILTAICDFGSPHPAESL